MAAGERTTFEETPENLAAEEAAFEAAINGTDVAAAPAPETTATNTDQPAEEVPNTEDQQQTDDTQPPAAAATEQPAKEPTIADLLAVIEEQRTEQQKLRDRVFGKVGELQQKIDAVRTTASGISPRARERLMNDFPELAEMLFESSEALETEPAASTATATQSQAQAPVASPEDSFTETQKVEMRFLARDHRDWQQVVMSPEFANWKDTVLSPQDAATLDDSWDADFVSAKLTEFKTYREAEAKKTQTRQARQERLDAALTPQGRPQRHTSSLGEDEEEAAMVANFKPR